MIHHGRAQQIYATLSGTVTDPAGAVVVGAELTVTNLANGLKVRAKSGTDGGYLLNELPDGNYQLTVVATGFRQYTRGPITLRSGDKAVVAVPLQVGAVTESLTVTAGLTGIESRESVTAQVLDSQELSELPLDGRNYIMLLPESTGVLFTVTTFGPSGWTMPNQWATGAATGAGFTMQGGQTGTNSFQMDGATQGVDGGMNYIPPPEAIQDTQVRAPTSDASLGLSGGGVVTNSMKSGGNEFHGYLTESFRNNVLEANQIQFNQSLAAQPWLSQQDQFNNFTGILSGRIIRNKLFFTGNYDGFRLHVAYPITISVPTALQRAGDFSQTFNSSGQLIVIYDPLTTQQVGNTFTRIPFPKNVIPQGSMVAPAVNITAMIPTPNINLNPLTGLNNFTSPNVGEQRYDAQFMRFDYLWNSNQRTTVFARATECP
jgi:hypothetical protein